MPDRAAPARASDRWVTPWVVVVLILAGTVIVLFLLAAVTYLTARGFDPQPVVSLTGTLVAAAAASGNFLLSLVKRKTETHTQAQVGRLASGVGDVLDELDAARGRHSGPEVGTAPAGPGSVDLDQDTGSSTRAPGRGPSYEAEGYSDTPSPDLQDTAWFRQ